MRAMRRGDWESAWRISDRLLSTHAAGPSTHLPRHLQPVWDGRPLAGRRVLVRCYHGLGDTVQFIRFARRQRRIAREVILWAQPALLPLLRTAGGIDRLIALHDGEPLIERDADIELMELPHALRILPRDLPGDLPYLGVRPRTCRRAGGAPPRIDRAAPVPAQRVRCRPRVGIGVPLWTLPPPHPDWRWMIRGERTPWYPSMTLWRQRPREGWEPLLERVAVALRALAVGRDARPRRAPVQCA